MDDKPVFESIEILSNKIEEETEKTKPIQKITSDDLLRTEVSSFIVSQMNTIQEQDSFRSMIIGAMKEKVKFRETDFKDLLSLYRAISSEKSENTRVLLDIFKPTSNVNNPLIRPKEQSNEGNDIQQFVEGADSKTLQGIFLLMKKIEAITNANKEETIDQKESED